MDTDTHIELEARIAVVAMTLMKAGLITPEEFGRRVKEEVSSIKQLLEVQSRAIENGDDPKKAVDDFVAMAIGIAKAQEIRNAVGREQDERA